MQLWSTELGSSRQCCQPWLHGALLGPGPGSISGWHTHGSRVQRGFHWTGLSLQQSSLAPRFALQVYGEQSPYQFFCSLIGTMKGSTCLKSCKNWHGVKRFSARQRAALPRDKGCQHPAGGDTSQPPWLRLCVSWAAALCHPTALQLNPSSVQGCAQHTCSHCPICTVMHVSLPSSCTASFGIRAGGTAAGIHLTCAGVQSI